MMSKWWRRFRIRKSEVRVESYWLEVSYFYLPFILLSSSTDYDTLVQIASNRIEGGTIL